MAFEPKVKPSLWSIRPGIVAYNCKAHGMPHPILAMPIWEGAGSRVIDQSGHGNNGTVYGAGWVADGLDFIPDTSYVDIGAIAEVSVNKPYSLVALFKADGTSGDHVLISISHNSTDRNVLIIDSNNLIANNYDGSFITKSVGFTDTTSWHSAVMTYDGSSVVAGYLDTVVMTGSVAGGTSLNAHGSIGGTGIDFPTYPRVFDGLIANAIIYDCVLNVAQVKFLYENPWFMYQIPEELYGYVAVAGGVAPTGVFYGPFYGPFMGAIG